VSNMNREKNLVMYGFVSVLLLASFLMTVPANQYQKIFAQTEGETAEDTQGNVTEENQENATDAEIPKFENRTATFVPPPEGERKAPPVPADAIKGDELPDEAPVKDPDSEPLSITNRTEILEVLPANSTKIIEHVDDDLKNSTGEGLLPPAILDKIKSGEGQGNDTILDISSPEELDEIKNFSESTTNQTTEEAVEEGEPISVSNVTNATATEAPPEEQEEASNVTNATGLETNVTTATGQEEAADGEEQAQAGGEETNVTNATGGEQPAQAREEQKQAEGEEEQANTAEEEQAQGGGEETNITNATSGEQPAQTREEQKQAEGEEEQANTAEEEQAQGGGEAITDATNATAAQPLKELLNKSNVTSMLNATGSEDENDSPEDGGEDE
jgi:hypothetical protein